MSASNGTKAGADDHELPHTKKEWAIGVSSLEIRTGFFFFFQVGYPVATSHFAATPQTDVVRICAHDFQRHGDAFGTTENACCRGFITLRSQFHLHHCSQRTLMEIVSKITPNLGLVL